MKEISIVVKNPNGLHARPAALVVSNAAKFTSKLTASKGPKDANLKSLFSVLSLGVSQNDQLNIKADGLDETEAIQKMISIINNLTD
jgi:phosphocarrier protein HPr